MLSDYGRDRLAYQGYDLLFDPEVRRRSLPTANRHIQRMQAIYATMDYLSQFAVPYPIYAGWGVTILELVGGIFIVLGALTPLVALLALVQQIALISYTNYWRGPNLLDQTGAYVGGWEYNVMLALLALVLLSFGPGRAAIDRLFRRPKETEVADDDTATSSSGNTSPMVSASTW